MTIRVFFFFEMIKIISNTKKYCSEDISLIENYNLAILSKEGFNQNKKGRLFTPAFIFTSFQKLP